MFFHLILWVYILEKISRNESYCIRFKILLYNKYLKIVRIRGLRVVTSLRSVTDRHGSIEQSSYRHHNHCDLHSKNKWKKKFVRFTSHIKYGEKLIKTEMKHRGRGQMYGKVDYRAYTIFVVLLERHMRISTVGYNSVLVTFNSLCNMSWTCLEQK